MRLSLRYKFILPFILFTVVLTVTFGVTAIQRLTYELRVQYERQGEQLALHTAGEVLEEQVLNLGHDNDLGLLARNLVAGDVIYLQIVLNGQVLAQQSRYLVNLPLVTTPARVVVYHLLTPSNGSPYLDLIHPLNHPLGILSRLGLVVTPEVKRRLQGGVDGYIRLGISLKRMEVEINRGSLLLAALSLGLMILSILVGWGLYRMILGPVERLSEAMREFGAGNSRARALVDSGDEIESLANEFNAMANSIVHQRDALRQTTDELERANQAKTIFLATMSHELRTPLHSILGYASLLLDEINVKLNKAGHQYAGAIQRSGKHLLVLIGNLLEFSKLEAGAERLHLTEQRAAQIVAEVVENQRPLAEEKGLRVEVEVESSLTLRTDETKLKQVLLNLLNNAIKYTSKGSVNIVAKASEGFAYFSVADTGSGIGPEVRAQLFEPFTRASDSAGPGVGLGLAVSKGYVELLGGTLSFESITGQGSHFWFRLPQGGPEDETADR
ncbi:MAG TPA: HAMP domain-containing histidine kinase [Candidatus Fraserbacteria bacterium]|nr:HAMP domain-containing histidine kinase [Candidatus Fraserbacteria bacterium]